jgi:hypothetical protein
VKTGKHESVALGVEQGKDEALVGSRVLERVVANDSQALHRPIALRADCFDLA